MFIFQILNDKMDNYTKKNITVNCIIQKLKNRHTLPKKVYVQTEKAKFSRQEKLSFKESVFNFQFLNDKMHNYVKKYTN